MSRLLLALALLVALAPASWAQSGVTHTFQILDGEVYLDGRRLSDAVPTRLDLAGMRTGLLEYSGPVAPVIKVDGQVYVLEDEQLIPLEESEQNVYILGEGTQMARTGLSEEQITPAVEPAYMQEVAARNRTLYEKMQRVAEMEAEAYDLVGQIQSLPQGDARRQLRDELRDRLSAILTLKHEIQAEELALAQDRLDELRARLDRREDQHDSIVQNRLRELVGQ